MVNIALRASGPDSCRSGLWVDTNTLYSRKIDDEPVVTAAKARSVMAAAADRDVQTLCAPELYRCYNFSDVSTLCDHPRTLVAHAVVELAAGIIVRVISLD